MGRFFVFIRQYAQICLYMKRHNLGQSPTELLWRHFFAKLDFITVLRGLINCSTPKIVSYNYSLEKLLWNVKFYLNQYFSQTSSHEIVQRNVKSTWEILNLDSKIKHLSPVFSTTAKLVSSESKNEPNTTQPFPQFSFSGHPPYGAVGQNIFPMYISIKRHSWFFKSWWCLLFWSCSDGDGR